MSAPGFIPGLTFGVASVLDFASDEPIGVSGYLYEASSAADGTDWGNPEAVVTEIQSQLLDGSLGKITSFGNRTATIALRIVAVDMNALAEAEAVLMGEVYRDGWNQLVWTPPNATVQTVFDVVYADLTFKLDDLDENRCIRNYTLSLTCLPRPRSADLVTVAALPVPPPEPTTVTVDDCSSVTGWSSPAGVTESGGKVVATLPGAGPLRLTRTGTVTMGTTPYLVVTFSCGGTVPESGIYIDDTLVFPTSVSVSGDVITATLYSPGSFSKFAIQVIDGGSPATSVSISVDKIERTNAVGAATPRQQWRQLSVPGSARAQASLRIETSEAELGSPVIVYTAPPQSSGFQPPLRAYRTGPSNPDSSRVSGAWNYLAESRDYAEFWQISTRALSAKTYELAALLYAPSAQTITLTWEAMGEANTMLPVLTGNRVVSLATGWQFVQIASIELPVARMLGSSEDFVNLRLWSPDGGGAVLSIDDAYLFGADGHLSVFDVSGCSLLLLNSATLDEPEATAWVGTAAGSTGGDPDVDTGVVYAGNRALAWDQHQFAPPSTNVYVATPGTTQAQVSMTFYPRWGHHAGQVPAA